MSSRTAPLLDLTLLQTFVAVNQTGTLAKAADKVGRTQSAVSLQMQRLEQALGKGIRRSRGPNDEAAKLHGRVQEATLNELPGLVPGFLKAAITSLPGDAAPLQKGEHPSPEDENLGIAADVNAWQRALVAWEQRIEIADSLRLELGRSEATLAKKAPSEDEAKAHADLVAAYNSARLDAERAELRALETRAGLEQAHQAARAH